MSEWECSVCRGEIDRNAPAVSDGGGKVAHTGCFRARVVIESKTAEIDALTARLARVREKVEAKIAAEKLIHNKCEEFAMHEAARGPMSRIVVLRQVIAILDAEEGK